MKKLDQIIDKLTYSIFLLLLLLLPLAILIRYLGLYFQKTSWYGLRLGPILWFFLPILLAFYLYRLFRKKSLLNKFDVFIWILAGLTLLSALFSVDMETAFIGEVDRDEGFLSLMTYFLLFLNAKQADNKKWTSLFLHCFLIMGWIQTFIAFEQIYFRSPKLPFFQFPYLAEGLATNPNFFASYMFLLTLLSLGCFLWKEKHRLFYLISFIICFSGMLLSQSTGVFLSFVATFCALLLFVWIKKQHLGKKIALLSIIIVITFVTITGSAEYISVNWYHDKLDPSYTIKGDILLMLSLVEKPVASPSEPPNKDEAALGSGRFQIWKNTIPLVPRYFFLGSGPDTLRNIYPSNNNRYYIDKAHNDFLQIAVTRGIPNLIVYLTLLWILFYRGIRTNQANVWLLLLPIVGYQVQMMMNISVLEVAPFYFILLGFLEKEETVLESKS